MVLLRVVLRQARKRVSNKVMLHKKKKKKCKDSYGYLGPEGPESQWSERGAATTKKVCVVVGVSRWSRWPGVAVTSSGVDLVAGVSGR